MLTGKQDRETRTAHAPACRGRGCASQMSLPGWDSPGTGRSFLSLVCHAFRGEALLAQRAVGGSSQAGWGEPELSPTATHLTPRSGDWGRRSRATPYSSTPRTEWLSLGALSYSAQDFLLQPFPKNSRCPVSGGWSQGREPPLSNQLVDKDAEFQCHLGSPEMPLQPASSRAKRGVPGLWGGWQEP